MSEKSNVNLSDDRLKRLRDEQFIAEVLKIRETNDSMPKPFWQKFLESSGGTALITVILGGLMGTIITVTFQYLAKEKELSVLNTQKFLEKRELITKDAYDLIGNSVVTADNLVKFQNLGLDPGLLKGKDKNYSETIMKDFRAVTEKFEESKQKWTSGKITTAMLLFVYYKNNEEVKTAWDKIDVSLTDYLDSVNECLRVQSNCSKCKDLKSVVDTDLAALQFSVLNSSSYSTTSQH